MPASTREARDARTQPRVPALELPVASIFLDFDGTLVDLAETPDGVRPDAALPDLLVALHRTTNGRTALISGRAAADVRGFLPSFPGVIVGGHGAETAEDGQVRRHPAAESPDLVSALAAAHDFAEGRPGLLVEEKPTGVVVHYRQAPEAAAEAAQFVEALAARYELFEYHAAKMAAELRPRGIGKEAAIARLMERDGWAGTRPVFFGDDATDEPALAWVAERGGIAVKVGEGESAAPHRLVDPAAVRAALTAWIEDRAK